MIEFISLIIAFIDLTVIQHTENENESKRLDESWSDSRFITPSRLTAPCSAIGSPRFPALELYNTL